MVRVAGGLGLGGILIIAAIIYFSGAGGWMVQRMQGLEGNCYDLISSARLSMGRPVCEGVRKGVDIITKLADQLGKPLQGTKEWVQAMISGKGMGTNAIGSFGSSFQQSIAGLSSSSDRLNQLINQGARQLSGGGTTAQQFQQAIDSFTIGQNYIAQGGNATQALPWLKQGASQPQGFGVLSQLSLGDLYRSGATGVAADPVQAQAYYSQASTSLALLSSSNTPQARQLLQTLPASPQAIRQQIEQIIREMKR